MKLWYSEWRARRRKKGWAITQTRAPEQKASGDERLWENWMANAIIRPSLSSLVPSFLFPAALLFGSTWQINAPTLSVSLSAGESPQLYLQSRATDTVVPDSVVKIQLIELSVCSDVTKHHLITAHLICWSAGCRGNLKKVTNVIRWIIGNTGA